MLYSGVVCLLMDLSNGIEVNSSSFNVFVKYFICVIHLSIISSEFDST